jgi:hypothetical protein
VLAERAVLILRQVGEGDGMVLGLLDCRPQAVAEVVHRATVEEAGFYLQHGSVTR